MKTLQGLPLTLKETYPLYIYKHTYIYIYIYIKLKFYSGIDIISLDGLSSTY